MVFKNPDMTGFFENKSASHFEADPYISTMINDEILNRRLRRVKSNPSNKEDYCLSSCYLAVLFKTSIALYHLKRK